MIVRFGKPWPAAEPQQDVQRLRDQMEQVFNALNNRAGRAGAGVYPLLNLAEDDDNLYVTAEMPGVSPADLEISVHNDDLLIRGERKIPDAAQNVNFHRREREAGIFRRVVSLPVKVDADKVDAAFKNGVLKITLPKAAEAKPKQITIRAE
jgi:HSP20 family protein